MSRALLALAAISLALPANAEPPGVLSASPERSSDGVFQLEWTQPGPVRLEESLDSDFRDAALIYEGKDRATTLSGRADGTYFYRLLALEPNRPAEADSTHAVGQTEVRVSHHPLSRALAFFGLGFLVFASTVVLIVVGDRKAGLEREPGHG